MTGAILKLLDKFGHERPLPEPLPGDPVPTFRAWFDEAVREKKQDNPNCMYLATCTGDGRPSVRTVLCKAIDPATGGIEFYTNYQSRKAGEIEQVWRAAILFHWDNKDRQVRLEGPVMRVSGEESDAYFRSRRWESRLGAWASDQSRPIASRKELLEKIGRTVDRLGLDALGLLAGRGVGIPRPAPWGGYRLMPERLELWQGGVGRVHDRAVWARDVRVEGSAWSVGAWSGTRLQP